MTLDNIDAQDYIQTFIFISQEVLLNYVNIHIITDNFSFDEKKNLVHL